MSLVEIDLRPWQEGRFVRNPSTATPPRRPNLLRRTSHIDMSRVGETMQHGIELAGAARDLRSGTSLEHGTPLEARVLGEASIRASLGANRVLEKVVPLPGTTANRLTPLLGRTVAAGFRAAVDACVPEERDAKTPLYLLLDDLPVASLIAGYADLYLSTADEPETKERRAAQSVKADICAGWASEATMMQEIERTGKIPTPARPACP